MVSFSFLSFFAFLSSLFSLPLAAVGFYGNAFPTAVSPWTTLGPLAFVISISLLNEAITDIKRHRSDRTTNNKQVTSLELNDLSLSEVSKPSKSLTVGDLVLLKNRDVIPADIVLLASSNDLGSAYVETSAIDGETNLKLRRSPSLPGGRTFCAHGDEDDSKLDLLRRVTTHRFVLDVEQPNESVATFTGTLSAPDVPDAVPLSADNFLVRGSVLRNTRYAIGVAVYTGVDTKLAKNSRRAPSKLSQLDRLVNRAIWMILLALSLVCTISASVATAYNTQGWVNSATYIYPETTGKPFSGCFGCTLSSTTTSNDPFPGTVNW